MVQSRMFLGLSRNFWFMLALIVLVTAAGIVGPRLYRMALLGSGYMAQLLCSGMFVSGRDYEDLMRQDLSGPGLEALGLFTPSVDTDAKDVSAAVFGLAGQTSIYREGLGCTLIDGRDEAELRAEAEGLFPPAPP